MISLLLQAEKIIRGRALPAPRANRSCFADLRQPPRVLTRPLPAIAPGRTQLGRYRDSVERMFEDDGKKAFQSGKLRIFQKCIKNERIHLDTQLRVYDFCPSNFKVGEDWVVE